MTIPAVLTELGVVLSVTYETDNEAITFDFPKTGKMRMVMACDGKGKNLFCMRQRHPTSKAPKETAALRKAVNRYELWSGYIVDSTRALKVSEKRFKPVGRITQIVYRSDKWDGWHDYVHAFENKTNLSMDNDDDPILMKISGSKLRITARGIEG
jgi:hypothetical protein